MANAPKSERAYTIFLNHGDPSREHTVASASVRGEDIFRELSRMLKNWPQWNLMGIVDDDAQHPSRKAFSHSNFQLTMRNDGNGKEFTVSNIPPFSVKDTITDALQRNPQYDIVSLLVQQDSPTRDSVTMGGRFGVE